MSYFAKQKIKFNMFTYIAKFLCGIGVFLFALVLLNNCIGNSQGKFNLSIQKRLHNCYFDSLIGFVAAAVSQSSSAVNSILVNLTDKKLIGRKNSYFIVIGANIGTTVTAYLAVLGKIGISNFFICVLFFSSLCLMLFNKSKIKNVFYYISIFSMIFIGLRIVNDASPYLLSHFEIDTLKNSNSYMLLLISIIITTLCHSSSLVSVVVVTMTGYNLLSLEGAMFMIMGANLGTCSTALIASIGKSKTGLSVAVFNTMFNVSGILLNQFLYHTGLLSYFMDLNVAMDTKIALYHTLFNVSTTLFVFPFIMHFDHIKLGKKLIVLYE